ncbi:glycosyltransferase [Pseudarthrobacter sp. PH31-O2]|uniref:glycosyltransferase n=1 Tax=Pseudarthrobacter sp. PH31-O2 TaxID=3046206 RepID=UPI0024BA67C6|nr:glycosyltransferase [Pseudarthrobacter sp. PH31-O2]MDJ0351342.1 glycosyltransferase [Pseudarthrobacter sp. PH31-O2]
MSQEENGLNYAYSEIAASERNSILLMDIRNLQQDRSDLEARLEELEVLLEETARDQKEILLSLRADRDALLRSLAVLRDRLDLAHNPPNEDLKREVRSVATSWRMPETQDVSSLRVAAIMDEFTTHAFTKACSLFPLSVEKWQADIEAARPNLLLVESAWEGNGGAWRGKINHLSPELIELVSWCRNRSIPTVFWNKEDPVHFNSFVSSASIFDFVFTTDFDSVQNYMSRFGHSNVFVLPFFGEPKLHSPLQTLPRLPGFSFAGTYYARYPERQQNFESIIDATSEIGDTVIFDRRFGGTDPAFVFPEKYGPLIQGNLPFSEVEKSYKGFEFGINLNSVKQSQTMYARRALDLMVSNTHVVSNYSRGLRLMFGDLVVSSDDANEIQRQVRLLLDPADTAKTSVLAAYKRLLALRKVLSEHTTANRLEYVAEKIWGGAVQRQLPWVRIVGHAHDNETMRQLLEVFQNQSWLNKRPTLVVGPDVDTRGIGASLGVEFLRESDAESVFGYELIEDAVAFLSADDAYGPDYIADLALAFLYSDAEVVGKSEQLNEATHDRTCEYIWKTSTPIRSSVCTTAALGKISLMVWLRDCNSAVIAGDKILVVDRFNYRRESPSGAAVFDSGSSFDVGRSMKSIQCAAEAIVPGRGNAMPTKGLLGDRLAMLFSGRSRSDHLSIEVQKDGLQIRSDLQASKHTYVYAGERIPLDMLQDDGGMLTIHPMASAGLKLSVVFVFFDRSANRMNHVVLNPGKNHEVAIPEDASSVLFGLRAQGSGTCTLQGIALEAIEAPAQTAPQLIRPKKLILTNVYPSSSALYRNGFIHSRVKGYEDAGVHCEVFCLNPRATPHSYEFEGVDVHVGSAADLRRFLGRQTVDHVLVHFLDAEMWPVVSDYSRSGRVTIWIHGAEVQPWYRRDFNYSSEAERSEAKTASDARMSLWRSVFVDVHPNVHFVFVSQYFAEEVMQDVGIALPASRFSIVHNYIDTELFDYIEKAPEHRFKLLSIRPFASRKYANDLTVESILILSREEFFEKLDIRIIGDGVLFDQTLEPLRHLENVTIEQRFLSRSEISAIHKDYGLFITPTRMDSQGVSRDEAMSSGLVPVTTAVTAIPEFVDSSCGILAPGEDAEGMAAGIAQIIRNPNDFVNMSSAAARRVRRQSAYAQTIGAELAMMR